VLIPLAMDQARGWILLPDGGPTLGERTSGQELVDGLDAALMPYGRLQRALEPEVGAMLAVGVPDMRPAVMPARLREGRSGSMSRRQDGRRGCGEGQRRH